MKIVVDAFGGDNSPDEVVKGAVEALNENKKLQLILVGNEQIIKNQLSQYKYDESRLEIVHASDVISCNDIPTEAIRKKTDSSLVVALKTLKENEDAKAFVSAGSTGAVLTGAILKIGRIKGLSRPALAPVLPTVIEGKQAMLIDCGANVDCKPINLVHFAIMGKTYMQEVHSVKAPKIALLSNGSEDAKGCQLTKEVFNILNNMPNINFAGNIEARDILSGQYDVIVTDGFAGNVALKTIEGTANAVFSVLKKQIKASKISMIGAFFMKKAFKNVKGMLDYNKKGGAIFLGANKVIIKAHGSSSAEAFKNAILQAYMASEFNLNDKIKQNIDALNITNIVEE